MDSIKENAGLASEMVALLGRELLVARGRIGELEQEVSAQRHKTAVTASSKSDSERAHAAEMAMNVLMKDYQELKDENGRLKEDLKCCQEENLRRLKVEERDHSVDTPEDVSVAESETDTTIQTLRADLIKAQAKCKKQREAKHKIRAAYSELELQLEEASVREQAYEKQLDDMQHKEKSKIAGNDDPHSNVRAWHETKPYYFLSSLPRAKDVPPRSNSKPICRRGMDLTKYIESNFSCKYLYYPRRISWCRTSHQHALAFSSPFIYESRQDRWRVNTEFPDLNKKTRELFLVEGPFIYYAGTYKCHFLGELHDPNIFYKSNDVSTNALLDAALPFAGPTRIGLSRPTIARFFEDGVLKIEGLGMQCIGFNHTLYNELLQLFEVEKPSKREVVNSYENDESDNQSKRRGYNP